MDTPKIISTKEYSIFNSVDFNRKKNERHIQQLKKIIQKENLLHLHPILVNEKMEVVDGQHRLEAAKELGLDIFYIQDRISYDHILNSNLFQKKLILEDVIKFYAVKDGIPSYLELQEYMNLLEISPKSLISLIFGTMSLPMIEFIKSGKFEMPRDKMYLEKVVFSFSKLKEFVKEKKITPYTMFSSTNFTVAFRNLVLLPDYIENIFFNKLSQRWFDLKPQINSKEWTRVLIGIYNWKNHNPIHLENA